MFSPYSSSVLKRTSYPSERSELKLSLPVFPPGWCTYMLICIDGSYYVGLTNDLPQRVHDHSSGKGPTYTKTTKPKLLVWYESHPSRQAAARILVKGAGVEFDFDWSSPFRLSAAGGRPSRVLNLI